MERKHLTAAEMSLILLIQDPFLMSTCRFNLPFLGVFFKKEIPIGAIITRYLMKNRSLSTFGISGIIWGMRLTAAEDAWVTANCAYLVVIVISVTRPDVLLSCEAAVGRADFLH